MEPVPHSIFMVTAAGGNCTALEILDEPRDRQWYQTRGRELEQIGKPYDVEQAGFVILPETRLEMTGGEFCGNASRAAALLLSKVLGLKTFRLNVSGTPHQVKATVSDEKLDHAYVQCDFTKLPNQVDHVSLSTGEDARFVDLKGIVHVLVFAPFPEGKDGDGEERYKKDHRRIMSELNLAHHPAVGVCWIQKDSRRTRMDPVVWVRDADTFYYESSCGSGSIATSFATGAEFIEQPSGKTIRVHQEGEITSLASEMEISHVIIP